MTTPELPPGWRRVRDDEIVAKGDMLSSDPDPNIDDWDRVFFTVGKRVGTYLTTSTVFIRQESEPEPEQKQWLNPWE